MGEKTQKFNIHLVGGSEGQKKKKKTREGKKIKQETNFLDLRVMSLPLKEPTGCSGTNMKFQNSKGKERVLKVSSKKKQVTYNGTKLRPALVSRQQGPQKWRFTHLHSQVIVNTGEKF